MFVQQVHHKEVISPFTISKMFERDFSEGERYSKALSQEGRRFLQNMKGGIHLTEDHHYEMPLPFRRDETEQEKSADSTPPVEKTLHKRSQI